MLTGRRFWIFALVLAVAALASGCASPEKQHYQADLKYLEGSGKKLLEYVDNDDKLAPEVKAVFHADFDTFYVEVKRGLGEK